MKVGALCAGYGGLELGLTLAGIEHELAWWSETDPHASKVMAHHHPDTPNLGDLTLVDDAPPVDIVTAGFPCQPVSSAGKRQGVDDERWLIHDVVGLARRARARWLILENVSGLYSANDGEALGQVCDALAEGGFDAEWAPLRASDVGACHRRLRWFCLAAAPDSGGVGWVERSGPRESEPSGLWRDGSDDDDRTVDLALTLLPTPTAGNPNDGETLESWEARRQRNIAKGYNGNGQGTPLGIAVHADFGQYGPAIARHEAVVTHRPAPSPTNEQGRLSAEFVEWMMGLPAGHVTDVPGLTRAQQLGRLGNGVVPQQAAAALTGLAARFDLERREVAA